MGLECNGISEDNQTSIHNQQLCFGLAACSDLTRKQDPYRQVFSLQSSLPVRANGICCANYLIFRKYFFYAKVFCTLPLGMSFTLIIVFT